MTKKSEKVVEPTTVKVPAKTKKPTTKTTKKVTKKVTKKPKAPVITDAMFEQYLLKRNAAEFKELVLLWNEHKLRVRIVQQKDYDGWLNYFKTMPARTLQTLSNTAMDVLPTDGYTALLRWRDIIKNPHRIDKIHMAALTDPERGKASNIVAMAAGNDRLGVLKAIRQQLAERIEKGAGARDTAALAEQMTEIMTQIADLEKRLGPKQDTVLGTLVHQAEYFKDRSRDKGTRNTKFASRTAVTVDDMED